MKHWLGRIERNVLRTLEQIRGRVELGVVVKFVFYGREGMTLGDCLKMPTPTHSQYNTVHRAVASLERKGYVRTSDCRFITTRPGPKTIRVVQLAEDG